MFPFHADDKGCGGKQDILLKGVYLTLWFDTLGISQIR